MKFIYNQHSGMEEPAWNENKRYNHVPSITRPASGRHRVARAYKNVQREESVGNRRGEY
jgi:hypothetical protein